MRSFGDLEARVMRVVWQNDEPVTVRLITEALQGPRLLAYTTVMTLPSDFGRRAG